MTAMIEPPKRRAVARGVRVLIAEDDAGSRWALNKLMTRLGYHCRVAADGEEALRLADSFAPRIILMDLMMPVLDGLEATRRLKAGVRTRAIPVVALTGRVTPESEADARRAGCDDVVAKPFLIDELLDRLGPYLRDGGAPFAEASLAEPDADAL